MAIVRRPVTGSALAALLVFGVFLFGRCATPPEPASDEAFTIYVLGGSVALGTPFEGAADFGQIVSHMYGGHIDQRPIRVVNLAKGGKNAETVLQSVDQVGADADVAFLYSGNNEFLRFDKRHDLRKLDRKLFDDALVDRADRQETMDRYARAVETIVTRLEEAGVPVVLSSVAVNARDWEPSRSILADPAHAKEMLALLEEGDTALREERAEDAIRSFETAIALEPGFALAHQRLGDAHRQAGHTDLARQAYRDAVRHDGNPKRAVAEQNAALEAIARRHGLGWVDAAGILSDASPDGLIGFDFMWDNCHPTLEGYALIAGGFAEAMRERLDLEDRPRPIAAGELQDALGIDDERMAKAAITMAGFCYRTSTLVWDPEPRLRRAWVYLDAAAALGYDGADLDCAKAVAAALGGDLDASLAHWKRAHAKDPELAEERMRMRYVRQLMQRAGLRDSSSVFR